MSTDEENEDYEEDEQQRSRGADTCCRWRRSVEQKMEKDEEKGSEMCTFCPGYVCVRMCASVCAVCACALP